MLDTQHCLHKQKNAARCPGLRHVGAQILDREGRVVARQARIQLRQLAHREEPGRAMNIGRDGRRLRPIAVAGKAHRDQAVIVRPNAAVLVAERVVRRITLRQRAYAPPAPQIRLHQSRHHPARTLRRHDAAPQQVTGIARDRPDGPFIAIEAQRIKARRLIPKHVVESCVQGIGLGMQRGRFPRIAQGGKAFGHAAPGGVNVALQLDQRLWPTHQGTVGRNQRLATILPSNVLIALAGPGSVLLKPVIIPVAVCVDPREATLSHRDQRPQQVHVARRAPGRVQRHQVQRRRVGRAVIGRVRDQAKCRQLTPP